MTLTTRRNRADHSGRTLVAFALPAVALMVAQLPSTGHGAAAQVHGQGGVIAEYHTNMVPNSTTYQGFRVPLGLTFEGRASNNLSLFLDIRYAYNQSPRTATSLGNTRLSEETSDGDRLPDGTRRRSSDGSEVAQPFTLSGGRGERSETPQIGFAYMQYASEVGLFRAGRIPRHWGLGVWRNAEWTPEGGTISTTDAVSATFDLTSTFSGSLYLEKNSEGSPTSLEDDADAFTVEALLADDPADVNASGLTRQIGVAFSNYEHKQTSTRFRILDLFAKVAAGGFAGETEIVYPSGNTKSLSYAELGGRSTKCPPQKNADDDEITCDSQRYEGLAALLRLRLQVAGTGAGPDKSLSIAATENARSRLPTSLLGDSHTLGLQVGYSRGDSDAFAGAGSADSTIRSTPFHPNLRPAFLMYNPTQSPVAGMPGNAVVNTVFVRGDYTYEGPGFGSITPAIIWGRLDQLNTKGGAAAGAVGRNKNLGLEVDIAYAYKTSDNVKFGIDSGIWFPGGGWRENGSKKPSPVYGIRTSASTSF
jgi:hypothetical protein